MHHFKIILVNNDAVKQSYKPRPRENEYFIFIDINTGTGKIFNYYTNKGKYMNNPIISLEKVDDLLDKWNNDKKSEASCYASIKVILSELEKIITEKKLSGYTSEKLGNLNGHIDAMFGADIDNGHPFNEHLSWSLAEISSLKSDQCFGLVGEK